LRNCATPSEGNPDLIAVLAPQAGVDDETHATWRERSGKFGRSVCPGKSNERLNERLRRCRATADLAGPGRAAREATKAWIWHLIIVDKIVQSVAREKQ